MRNVGTHAVLAVALMLGGCFSYPYTYIKPLGVNVEATREGRPPVDFGRFRGDPIPIGYALEERGVSLTFAVRAPKGFGTSNLDLASSVPIRAVSIDRGDALRLSPYEYRLTHGSRASPAEVGDVVEITINLEDRPDAVSILGVIE